MLFTVSYFYEEIPWKIIFSVEEYTQRILKYPRTLFRYFPIFYFSLNKVFTSWYTLCRYISTYESFLCRVAVATTLLSHKKKKKLFFFARWDIPKKLNNVVMKNCNATVIILLQATHIHYTWRRKGKKRVFLPPIKFVQKEIFSQFKLHWKSWNDFYCKANDGPITFIL